MNAALRVALGCALVALVGVAPAVAELYRCEGPDGSTVFTDQKGACPDADPFEPSGVILNAPSPRRAHDPAALDPDEEEARGLSLDETSPEEAVENHWRQKKRLAEERLEQIRSDRDEMRPALIHCNRGGWVYTRDEAGIQQRVECDEIQRAYRALDNQEREALTYRDRGLRDECRKAGCLPGWVR